MIEQKLIRVYPPTYVYPKIKELNEYLSDGWRVVRVTVLTSKENQQVSDYIIERKKK